MSTCCATSLEACWPSSTSCAAENMFQPGFSAVRPVPAMGAALLELAPTRRALFDVVGPAGALLALPANGRNWNC